MGTGDGHEDARIGGERWGGGVRGVFRNLGGGIDGYYFDAQTEALIGARVESDVPFGSCQAYEYVGGTVPSPNGCVDATTCSLCAASQGSAGSGAGGAPAGGMGGTSGAALPPACPQ